MEILRSALGRYEPVGNPTEVDCIIGHSFGTSIDPESPNGQLATFITEFNLDSGLHVIADRTLANAFYEDDQLTCIVDGPISNGVGQGVGTWGTFLEAVKFMKEQGLERPLLVAQAHHIGRVTMQARHPDIALDPVVPDCLPADFDTKSDQLWTRSLPLWLMREIPGAYVLRRQGKL